ncbi:liver carboxylesterase 1-like, partial [Gracilinanus agilis]|uniref:liver carboxylesterase 1-like n=1 Tax=Gracilinanus agilis TaxID=191870 RepID=UPI001CFC638E
PLYLTSQISASGMRQRPAPNKMWLISLVLCSFIVFTTQESESSAPVVDTEYGKVQGKQVILQQFDKTVNVFLGVPFAKAPLGPLRFAPPQPPEPWDYVKNTTTYPPVCAQVQIGGEIIAKLFRNNLGLKNSEDCLYLNIYTSADLTTKTKLPVMVWIHGGALLVGEASTLTGMYLSALENVVVVAIQYRLGIFGFFSTGDEHARGNWGYLDQVAALHWVQKNIGYFGGDSNSVTIFGVSAGGISVSALVLSPLTTNLFHRAISQSGVAITESLFSSNIKPIAEKIAGLAGCKTTTSASIVHCMRQKTEEEILNTTQKMELFTLDFLGDPTQVSYPCFPNYLRLNFLKIQLTQGSCILSFALIIFAEHSPEEEKQLSRKMMKYWANFARNGNPNGEGLLNWPVYDQNENYLQINVNMKTAKKLKEKEVAFWTELTAEKPVDVHRENIEL